VFQASRSRLQEIGAPADLQHVHIVTLSKYGIREIVDLANRHVSLGVSGELTEMHAVDALKAEGFKCGENVICEHNPNKIQLEKLLAGKIEAFSVTDYPGYEQSGTS